MSIVKNLKYSIDNFTIDIPNWEILDVGVTALIGASGSGKSTVIRLLLGLENCPDLSWDFKGLDLAKLTPAEKKIGILFQSYDLFPHLSVKENIEFAAAARIKNKVLVNEKVNLFIDKLNLQNCLNTAASKISGGEKQRTALARALVGEPRILILDEPFSALDENLKDQARLLVKELISELKIPCLLVTHDQKDLDFLAQKICKISYGKIVE